MAIGVRLVAISSDTVEEAGKMRRSVGYRHIRFLSDPNAEVIGRYGWPTATVTYIRGPFPLAVPTTLLIDADGIVCWIDQAVDWRVRTHASEVLAAVKHLKPSVLGD